MKVEFETSKEIFEDKKKWKEFVHLGYIYQFVNTEDVVKEGDTVKGILYYRRRC